MVSRVNIVGYDCGVEYDPDGYYVKYADYAALKAENERLTKERNALTRSNARMQAERALAERAGGVKVTQTYILREWFGGERYARDYEYLDANYGKQASRVVEWLSTLTTEPAAPMALPSNCAAAQNDGDHIRQPAAPEVGRQEAVATDYLRGQIGEILCLELDADENSQALSQAVERILALTRPSEQAVTDAARVVLEWYERDGSVGGAVEPFEALKAAMEAGG